MGQSAVREFYIYLSGTTREDGSVFITSPSIPFFHVVGASEDSALETALSILKEHIQMNHHVRVVDVRVVHEVKDLASPEHDTRRIPANVIAQIAA